MTHGARRISIRVKDAELQRVGYGLGQSVQMVTSNEGVRRNLDVFVEQGDWAGSVGGCGEGGTEGEVRCAIRHSIDYTRERDRRQLPATVCCSSPRWVKFRVLGYRYGESGGYLDDALRDGRLSLSENYAQSRRVYRAKLTSPLHDDKPRVEHRWCPTRRALRPCRRTPTPPVAAPRRGTDLPLSGHSTE